MQKIIALITVLITILSLLCSCSGLRSSNVSPYDTTKAPETEAVTEKVTEAETTILEETTQPPVTTSAPETTIPETTEAAPVTTSGELTDTTGRFSNCLFIGDSRTVGLGMYSSLDGATVFAATGLNVFRIFSDSIQVEGYGSITLSSLLSSTKYEKIYVMLGINEIGYNHEYVVKEYGKAIDSIREKQPDAIIYIMANLHIVKSRSDKDDVYNNTGMNELNNGMKAFANGSTIKYLDSNVLFDDEYGALNSEYTVDDFHLLGEYYQKWTEWIFENS